MTEQQYEKANELKSEIMEIESALVSARNLKMWQYINRCSGESNEFLERLHSEIQSHSVEAMKTRIAELKVEFGDL